VLCVHVTTFNLDLTETGVKETTETVRGLSRPYEKWGAALARFGPIPSSVPMLATRPLAFSGY
jgi:hypothetical protein